MAKINYERVKNKANFIPLGSVATGNVIKWEDELYIVTNSYEDVSGEVCYRRIMNITDRASFGIVEYVDENTDVEIVEDIEITIKY